MFGWVEAKDAWAYRGTVGEGDSSSGSISCGMSVESDFGTG